MKGSTEAHKYSLSLYLIYNLYVYLYVNLVYSHL